MNVLIIPEDQENDRYIVKPITEALFSDLGISARVHVLPEPRLRGADQALDAEFVSKIIKYNPMTNLFLLIIDRDCDRRNHTNRANARQTEHRDCLIACVAWQEIEVWMLALHREHLGDRRRLPFSEVRKHCDPKEHIAEPFLIRQGMDGPGNGRKRAMQALPGKIRALCDLCPELKELRSNIHRFSTKRSST